MSKKVATKHPVSPRAAAKSPKKGVTKKPQAKEVVSDSDRISIRIAELSDWRGKTLNTMRKLITQAIPDVIEEVKWRGTPVWSHNGIICTGESYKDYIKLTFAKGASLTDPSQLFNASLEGNTRRAIDIGEGDVISKTAFKALVRQAAALNTAGKKKSKFK